MAYIGKYPPERRYASLILIHLLLQVLQFKFEFTKQYDDNDAQKIKTFFSSVLTIQSGQTANYGSC